MAGLLSVLLGKILTDNLLRFIATKTLLATLFIVVLPIVLNNFVYELVSYALDMASSVDSSSLPDLTLSFTGLAGWFASNLYLPDALSVVISAVSVRVFLNHIPFLRL